MIRSIIFLVSLICLFVRLFVEQAVKSLCDIWHPDDIPPDFRTTSRTAISTAIGSLPHPQPQPITSTPCHTSSRNPQLPSPVSPSTQFSPFPIPPSASPTSPPNEETTLLPIKGFVHEVLRRSRTSAGVLQTALCYLEAVRRKVPHLVQKQKLASTQGLYFDIDDAEPRIIIGDPEEIVADDQAQPASTQNGCDWNMIPTVRISDDGQQALPTAPLSQRLFFSPASDILSDAEQPHTVSGAPSASPSPSPLLCPRRTFLACLILASKFMQDRSYSNRAWAKLAGLPPREIGRCERALGNLLEWRLWVGKGVTMNSRSVARSRSDGDVLYASQPAAVSRNPACPAVPRRRAIFQRSATLPNLGCHPISAMQEHPYPAVAPSTSHWLSEQFECATVSYLPGPPTVSCAAEVPAQSSVFSAAVFQQVFISPPLSTPPLTYSPSPSSSSSDEGERTVQMNPFIDLPAPMSTCHPMRKAMHDSQVPWTLTLS